MFEFLFNYPASQYRNGVPELSLPWDWFFVVAAAIAVASWLFLAPRSPVAGGRGGRAALVALRSALLVSIVFCLLSPRLVVEVPRDAEGRVAVLLDDSLSMRIANRDGTTRAQDALERFAPGRGTVSSELEKRFAVTYYRFSDWASPLSAPEALRFNAPGTDLAGAVDSILGGSSGAPAPAIVLVTDGGDDRVGSLGDTIARLRFAGAPVYAVDLGAGPRASDIAVAGVRAPSRIRLGETFKAGVTLRHAGFGDREVRLLLEEGGLVVAERRVILPQTGGEARVDISHRFDVAGPHDIVVRVPIEEDESIIVNNEMFLALEITDEAIDVLHLEGEPRFEVKFIRRALAGEPDVRLVSLVHTSDSKLFRVGVDSAEELAHGFPHTAEDLFRYEVVILGSVPDAQLDEAQQQLLADFVGHRGGGLLLLGGRHAFAEGGYDRTRLAAVMPVFLDAASTRRYDVRPVPDGLAAGHPILDGFDPLAWQSLPPLAVINPVRRAKPGAQVLLGGVSDGGDELVMLAVQRYGRGRAAAFPVRNSWRWQMHADVAAEDTMHELFWRRLVRWLGQAAEGVLSLDAPSLGVPGRAVEVSARVLDAAYRPVRNAMVELDIDTPDGARITRTMTWRRGDDGRYGARFTPAVAGRYDLRATLIDSGAPSTSASRGFMVSDTGREFAGDRDAGPLRRLAAASGGGYYRTEEADRLLEDLAAARTAGTELKRLPLWDMPFLYLFMLALVLAEWWLRRRRGLR